MKLTRSEFARIRPLHWQLKYVGNMVYNTPASDVETELFWLDFMRLIFAPKYKQQHGVTNIQNFDQTQPVLITDSLEILLPVQLETAMYYANNSTEPFRLRLPFSQLAVFVLAIIIMLTLVVFDFWRLNRKNTNTTKPSPNQQQQSTTATINGIRL